MKLIGSLTSPFVRKVRIVLAEKRIECDFEIDIPSSPETRVPEFNPLGKIPVLVTDDRTRLFDSRVIVEYLDSISPVNRLIPETARQRIQVRRWEALADGILDAAVLLVQEGRRPAAQQYLPVVERQRGKIDRGLALASEELADKPWCNADGYSLADIALGCMLGFLDFRFPDIAWRPVHPNLARHADKLSKLEPFALTAPRD
jgi:glutathione S-transferase